MVPICILDAAEDARAKLLHKHRLLLGADILDRLKRVPSELQVDTKHGTIVRTFCTTRQPYICNDKPRTWPSIVLTRRAFCAAVPYSNIFCTT